MSRVKKIIGSFVHAPGRFDELAQRIAETNHRIGESEKGLREQINRLDIDWFMDQLCEDRELLKRLNRGLSIAPTVWGDPERLEIDGTAKVFSCFFNTNSGKIRIGGYTFAGSGVSLLAGTHDPKLTGELRRDEERTEGCDIEIGEGVWLASGCTLLGPCRVGDNAVIAAGAVVTPGTEVPASTVWGGVPAKQIGEIETAEMTADHPAVIEAFERSGGILFTEGWGERIPGLLDAPGRWMCRREAKLLTDRKEWRLSWRKEGIGSCRLRLEGSAGAEEIVLTESEGVCRLVCPVGGDRPEEVRLGRDLEASVFLAFTPILKTGRTGPEEPDGGECPSAGGTDPDEPLDIEAIMDEIRAEAAKATPVEAVRDFEQIPVGEDDGETLLRRMAQVKASGACPELEALLETAVRAIRKQQEQIDELNERIREAGK